MTGSASDAGPHHLVLPRGRVAPKAINTHCIIKIEVRHLLEPICREGRLPSLGTREEYEAMALAAGFAITG